MYTMTFLYIFITLLFISIINSKSDTSVSRRNKRYIAFPEGASLSVALCLTLNTFLYSPIVVTEGTNWSISYDLPNSTTILESLNKNKHVRERSLRSNIYEKIESFLNKLGFDGRSCILRTLCEIEQKIPQRDKTIMEKLLEIVFRFPVHRLRDSEPEIHRFYLEARWLARIQNCDSSFPGCHFSLLDLVLIYAH